MVGDFAPLVLVLQMLLRGGSEEGNGVLCSGQGRDEHVGSTVSRAVVGRADKSQLDGMSNQKGWEAGNIPWLDKGKHVTAS